MFWRKVWQSQCCLDLLKLDFDKLPLDILLPLVVQLFQVNYIWFNFVNTEASKEKLENFHSEVYYWT